MNILGIITEYNPFHNGHLHLINEARKMENFNAVVCVMSGSFVQRGEPAICSKWARAEMAIRSGVDLIIELPFAYAVRSAYYFARGALELLHKTGIITHIAFGSESGDIELLKTVSRIIANEPDDYRIILKDKLNLGLSYPTARAKALGEYLINTDNNIHDLDILLSGPNNILGFEYLRVIEELNLPIIPLTISRKGAAYHDTGLSMLSSASAIRHAVSDTQGLKDIAPAMPQAAYDILQREILAGRAPILPYYLEQALLARLRTLSIHELRQICEVSEGLEYRIHEAAMSCGTLKDLQQYIKSRRYSLTRINRILLYALFGVQKEMIEELDEQGPMYIHILGLSSTGRQILQEIKHKSSLQVLNRGKDVKRFYEEYKGYSPGNMLALDIKTTDIYNLLMPEPGQRGAAQDFTTSPVIK